MDHETFRAQIAETPHDSSRQLAYADWLEQQRDPLANYVRLWSQGRGHYSREERDALFQRRKAVREQMPEICREWDLFIQVASARATLEQVRPIIDNYPIECAFNPPARANEVAELEQQIGCDLPPAYRRTLLDVLNGGGECDDWLLSIPQILKRLSDRGPTISEDFPIRRDQAMLLNVQSILDEDADAWYAEHSIDPADWDCREAVFSDRGRRGTVPILTQKYGDVFLVVRGELRGAVGYQGCDSDGIFYDWNTEEITNFSDFIVDWVTRYYREAKSWARHVCETCGVTNHFRRSGTPPFTCHNYQCREKYTPSSELLD